MNWLTEQWMQENDNKKILVAIVIILSILGTILLLPLALAFGKSGRDTKVLGRNYSMLSKKKFRKGLIKIFPWLG